MLRRGVPKGLTLLLLLLAIYGVIIVLAAILAYSIARLATILPDYAASARGRAGRHASTGCPPWASTVPSCADATSVLDVNRLAG